MSQNRKLSGPADNPQYFSVTEWPTQAQGAAMATEDLNTPRLTMEDLGDLEPTTEVVESLRTIEKLAEKQSSTKSKTTSTKLRKLGSWFSLFSSSQRRGSSSGVENEYIPTPAGHQYGSLPSTPTKNNNNNSFRLSTDSSKTHRARLGTPISPAKTEPEPEPEPRSYYNLESRSNTLRPAGSKTPAKHNKPPPGPCRLPTPQKTRSFSAGNSFQRPDNCRCEGWPGLEAPALPVLHRACHGYLVKDLPRTVILYSGGCSASRRWRDYLAKALVESLGGDDLSIRGQRLEEFSELSGPGQGEERKRCEEIVYHTDLVLVILTPKFMSWLEKYRIVLGKILRPGRVVGLFEGMTPGDITPTAANCLQTLPCWRTVVLNQSEENTDNTDFLIGNNCKEILQRQDLLNAPIAEARFKLFPKKFSANQNKMMIMMDSCIDQLDREHLELKVCQEDYHYTIEEAKWIKEDIVQVELPAVVFQSTMIARLELRLNDTNYGSRQIKLENPATVLDNAWQQCTDPVTILSEAFDVRFVNIQDIDEFLSASLEEKLSISDLLKTKYTGCDTDNNNCCRCKNKDHHNLLHFGAKHGLSRLCGTLISLGYERYLNLPNILGFNPAEIAEKSGHHSLGQELRGAMPAGHEYQYPSLGLGLGKVREGEDGYLLPHGDTTQYFQHDYQLPGVPPDKSGRDDFYQVPPAPVPLPARKSPPASTSSSSSSPPKMRHVGYLPMMPPLRKAMSEPRPDNSMFIPKSGSFSHFTCTKRVKSKSSTASQDPKLSILSCSELIETYCKDDTERRPESTPPSLGCHIAETVPPTPATPPTPPTPPVNIDKNSNFASQEQSSPLQHFVHTEPNRDGIVYLPNIPNMYDVPRRLSVETKQSPDQTFLGQIKEAQKFSSVIKNNNEGAYENVILRNENTF